MAPKCRKRKAGSGRKGRVQKRTTPTVHDRLEYYFRPHVEKAEGARGVFDWRSVRRSKRFLSRHLAYDEQVSRQHVDFVFGLFERYDCTNSALLKKWLKEYCKLRLKSYGYILVRGDRSRKIVCVYQRGNYSIRVPRYELILVPFSVRKLLLKPFLLQDEELIDKLLTYRGIRSHCMRKLDPCYLIMDVLDRMQEDPRMKNKITMFYPAHWQGECIQTKTRLKVVLLGMDVVLQNRAGLQNASSAIRSLRRIFSALTQPFITLREVAHILDMVIVSAEKEQIVEGFCHDFVESFPRAEEAYQPRKLKHLCRCKIRSRLRKCKTLPYGVRQLDIPNILHNYILLRT